MSKLIFLLSVFSVSLLPENAQDFWEHIVLIPGSLCSGPIVVNEHGHVFVGTKGDPSNNGVFRSTANAKTCARSGPKEYNQF